MSEDKVTDETVDSSLEQRRFPRVPEAHRLFLIFGTQRFQAETVDISRTGMLAACPVIPPEFNRGSEVLFELIRRSEPEENTFIKGTVARVIRDSDYDNILLGVEFSEALSRSPVALRGFIEDILGIERGAIRVIKHSDEKKSLVFDFSPVHREGEERLRAVRNSLFTTVDDLDEADRLLEGFGTGEYLFGPDSTGPVPVTGEDAPAEENEAEPRLERMTPAVPAPAVPAPAVPARQSVPGRETETVVPPKKRTKKKIRTPVPGLVDVLLTSVIPSLGRSERGDELISSDQGRTSVANIEGLDVAFVIDGKKRRARAVRLYFAGVKCEVTDGLPELYRSVTLYVPIQGRKRGEAVLNGDITRVRSDPNSNTKGIFEVRFSLRNETGMLNAYRQMVVNLSIGEG